MRRVSTFAPLLLLFGLVLFTSGCGDDGQSRLRVVHASPDAPNVDVYVDGSAALTNIAYKSASDYIPLAAKTHNIEVRPTGTQTAVITAAPALVDKTDYTALAVGQVASIELLLLTDDNRAPGSGQIKLRVVHGSPSAGNVDVYITAPGADISAAQPNLTDVPFKAASAYLEVPAGTYQVRVTPTGTKTVAIDSGSLTLQSGQVRTAVALDATGGGAPFTAIVLNDLN